MKPLWTHKYARATTQICGSLGRLTSVLEPGGVQRNLDEIAPVRWFHEGVVRSGFRYGIGEASLELGFCELGLTMIIAMVLPGHVGQISVLEKLDFTYEQNVYGALVRKYVIQVNLKVPRSWIFPNEVRL